MQDRFYTKAYYFFSSYPPLWFFYVVVDCKKYVLDCKQVIPGCFKDKASHCTDTESTCPIKKLAGIYKESPSSERTYQHVDHDIKLIMREDNNWWFHLNVSFERNSTFMIFITHLSNITENRGIFIREPQLISDPIWIIVVHGNSSFIQEYLPHKISLQFICLETRKYVFFYFLTPTCK